MRFLLAACVALLAGCGATTEPTAAPAVEEPPATAAFPAATSETEDGVPPNHYRAQGRSTLTAAAACLPIGPAGCFGYHEWEDGTFELPVTFASGVLTASWDPSLPTAARLHVAVVGTDDVRWSAEGESPLVLTLADLPSGEFSVAVRTASPAGASRGQVVDWVLEAS